MPEKNTLVITGGSIDAAFAESILSAYHFDRIFAAEGGAAFLLDRGIRPDYVISDFDSAGERLFDRLAEAGVKTDHVPVRKDETDTGLILSAALEEEPLSVTMLGASGTRIDHMLGNIMLLARFAKQYPHIPVRMVDPYNTVTAHTLPFTLKKPDAGGPRYLSCFALEEVPDLSISGVSYPVSDFTLRVGDTVCISNYITENTAAVSFTSGLLVTIESSDAAHMPNFI